MNTLDGFYFDGISARGQPVQLHCNGETLTLSGAEIAIDVPLAQVILSPRLGRTRRQLLFSDGAVCELDDDPLLDEWFADSSHRRWNLLARLEAHWGMVLGALLLVTALAAATALWGFPWLAQRVAMRVPAQWVDQLGHGTLTALDKALGSESSLTPERQAQLRGEFIELAKAAEVDAHFEFRDWPKLGANAIALPDGTIAMTDALVALAEDDRELLAVIAHELGHVRERHALQQLIAGSGVAALVFVLTGDVSGLSHIAVAAPTLLTQMRNSRELESSADRFGFALLAQQQIDPAWFARIIRKLEAAHRQSESAKNKQADNSDTADSFGGWLQSHPASEERAKLAEQFSKH